MAHRQRAQLSRKVGVPSLLVPFSVAGVTGRWGFSRERLRKIDDLGDACPKRISVRPVITIVPWTVKAFAAPNPIATSRAQRV